MDGYVCKQCGKGDDVIECESCGDLYCDDCYPQSIGNIVCDHGDTTVVKSDGSEA